MLHNLGSFSLCDKKRKPHITLITLYTQNSPTTLQERQSQPHFKDEKMEIQGLDHLPKDTEPIQTQDSHLDMPGIQS